MVDLKEQLRTCVGNFLHEHFPDDSFNKDNIDTLVFSVLFNLRRFHLDTDPSPLAVFFGLSEKLREEAQKISDKQQRDDLLENAFVFNSIARWIARQS